MADADTFVGIYDSIYLGFVVWQINKTEEKPKNRYLISVREMTTLSYVAYRRTLNNCEN